MEVFGGVFVLRVVAATDVSADQTHPKVDPFVTTFQTLFATPSTWLDVADLFHVCASPHRVHYSFGRALVEARQGAGSVQLTKSVKTQVTVTREFLARQDDCTAKSEPIGEPSRREGRPPSGADWEAYHESSLERLHDNGLIYCGRQIESSGGPSTKLRCLDAGPHP